MPAAITRSVFASRSACVCVERTVIRSRTAGSGCASVGTGGSRDRPPQPMTSVRPGSVSSHAPIASPRRAQRRTRGMPGCATALTKSGITGGVSSPAQTTCSACAKPWSTCIRRDSATSNSRSISQAASRSASSAGTFSGPSGVP